jgi:hypothetical protein
MFSETSKYWGLLWNHYCPRWTNVRGFRGSPLPVQILFNLYQSYPFYYLPMKLCPHKFVKFWIYPQTLTPHEEKRFHCIRWPSLCQVRKKYVWNVCTIVLLNIWVPNIYLHLSRVPMCSESFWYHDISARMFRNSQSPRSVCIHYIQLIFLKTLNLRGLWWNSLVL